MSICEKVFSKFLKKGVKQQDKSSYQFISSIFVGISPPFPKFYSNSLKCCSCFIMPHSHRIINRNVLYSHHWTPICLRLSNFDTLPKMKTDRTQHSASFSIRGVFPVSDNRSTEQTGRTSIIQYSGRCRHRDFLQIPPGTRLVKCSDVSTILCIDFISICVDIVCCCYDGTATTGCAEL